MAGSGIFRLVGSWRSVAVLAIVMAIVMDGTGSVSAQSPSASSSAQVHVLKTLPVAAATRAGAPNAVPHITVAGCDFEWFCAYPDVNFGGQSIQMFDCNVDVYIPFIGNGSWVNNQTSGTRAKFKDVNHNVIATTSGAFSTKISENWTPIFYVQAC